MPIGDKAAAVCIFINRNCSRLDWFPFRNSLQSLCDAKLVSTFLELKQLCIDLDLCWVETIDLATRLS